MTSKNTQSLSLPSTLGVENIVDQSVRWQEALQPKSTLTIDVSALEDIDTAGFQALIGLVNSATSADSTIRWHGSDGVFGDLAELADVYHALRLAQPTDAEDTSGLCPVY